jgi:ssRNA-specific RNase YbeY (16S rRNA maturation enzyme)
MRLNLLLLLPILAACESLSPPPVTVPPVADPCSDANAAIRQNSCVAIKPQAGPFAAVFAWADGSNTWPKGDNGIAEVSVQFLQGSEWARQQVWKRIVTIDALAEGLAFRAAEHGEVGDIRVAFSCAGHWSYLGRLALRVPEDKATLNIALDRHSGPIEWDRVVLHEVLHAVGFEHEHQHPQSDIPWNKEAVYAFYAETQGWSRGQVDFQVLNRGNPQHLRSSGVDDESIMQYPIPRGLTTNGYSVGWNTRLTASDVALLRSLYPKP